MKMKSQDGRLKKLEKAVGMKGKNRPVQIDQIKFSEEQVEGYRKICMLYDEHVREYPDINEQGEPGSDADLKKRGRYWLKRLARAYACLLTTPRLLEKAKSVPGLSAWAKSIEDLNKRRAEG
jgi:galactose-1-phosphate uridylyltransferase